MPLRQQFSTTIYSWDGEMSAEVLFLPKTDMAIPDTNDPQWRFPSDEYLKSVVQAFDPAFLAPVQAHNLEYGLAAFLEAANTENANVWNANLSKAAVNAPLPIALDALGFLRSGVQALSPEYLDFAKELLSSSRIPIEESPLSGIPLGELFSRASKASPTGLGAFIGWIIAGNTPLLLLWVPVGIILVRGAVGIGKGLEEGLQARIKKLFTPHRARKG